MALFGPSQSKQNFARLAAEFGGVSAQSENILSVDCVGRKLTAVFNEHKGNVTFTVNLLGLNVPEAIFRKENGVDRFGRQLGFGYEPQTRDALFDDNVFVACRRGDEAIERLCAADGVRKGALFLLQSGFEKVDFNSQGITIERHYGRNFNLDSKQFRELITAFEMIAAALPPFSEWELTRSQWRPLAVASATGIAAIVTGFVLMLASTIKYPTLDWGPQVSGLMLGATLWFVTIFLGARWMRGKIDAFRAWLLGAGLMAVGSPLCCVGMIVLLNGLLDSSPPVSHTVQLVNKTSSTSGKSGRKYYIHVKSWRPGEREIRIKVSSSYYNSVSTYMPVVVVTKQGTFGYEWIVSP